MTDTELQDVFARADALYQLCDKHKLPTIIAIMIQPIGFIKAVGPLDDLITIHAALAASIQSEQERHSTQCNHNNN